MPAPRESHKPAEVRRLIDALHAAGMRVVLKPHVDVSDYTWRGEIGPPGRLAASARRVWVRAWFSTHIRFLLRHARMGRDRHVDALVGGTELKSLIGRRYRKYWEKAVRRVRKACPGKLVYAANWDNYRKACLWDLVYTVSIDAHFPLSNKRRPSRAELRRGWTPWKAELGPWQKTVSKEIVFTDIGYRSADYAAREPWEYIAERPVNLGLQADYYLAVLEALRDRPWFKGVFLWP